MNFADELRSKPHASVSYSANFRFVLTGSKILDPVLDCQQFFCGFYPDDGYDPCGAFESLAWSFAFSLGCCKESASAFGCWLLRYPYRLAHSCWPSRQRAIEQNEADYHWIFDHILLASCPSCVVGYDCSSRCSTRQFGLSKMKLLHLA